MTQEQIEKLMQFILDQQAKSLQTQAEGDKRREEFEISTKNKMDFILEQQAKYEISTKNKMDFILEQQAKHEIEIQDLRAKGEESTKNLKEAVASLNNSIERVSAQAEQGRHEMREAVEALISNSEDIRNITKQLTTAVIGINKRVKRLENKAT